MKRLKHFFTVWEGLWSIPLTFLVFLGFGLAGQLIFGRGFGFYDPSFFQAALMSVAIFVLFNFFTWFGLWFNFRGAFRYFIGKKQTDGSIYNKSKEDAQNLTPWQRLKISLFLYCFFVVVLLVIFRSLV